METEIKSRESDQSARFDDDNDDDNDYDVNIHYMSEDLHLDFDTLSVKNIINFFLIFN